MERGRAASIDAWPVLTAMLEVRRQALYRAGELYLQTDDVDGAMESFRRRTRDTYPQPADLALEAMQHMDSCIRTPGDQAKRRFWLHKKIELVATMGNAAPDRAKYLAAEAQLVLADDARAAFDAVELADPLATSLKRKQQALKETIAAYERAASYGVAEFATASTYQIADIYAALSRELMASARPEGSIRHGAGAIRRAARGAGVPVRRTGDFDSRDQRAPQLGRRVRPMGSEELRSTARVGAGAFRQARDAGGLCRYDSLAS